MQHDVQDAEDLPSDCVGSYEGPWVQALGHLERHQVLDTLQASLNGTEKEKLINTANITPLM